MEEKKMGYLIVTDYVEANTGADVSDAIQELIVNNPHRTIYFPDGEYVLAKPICTPADPNKSVSLMLSNYAILKAADNWDSDEAMVRLGGIDPFNSIYILGSNYFFEGGIIDGGKKAKGISIDSGRETRISKVSIKNTTIGLHVKRGANNGSSDADIDNVNIVGTRQQGCIGVLVEGLDNTFTNMRIAAVQEGVRLYGGGNFLRNVHPLGGAKQDDPDYYPNSYGFREMGGGNFYDMCYSDQYATAFLIAERSRSVYNACVASWWSADNGYHVGFRVIDEGCLNATILYSKVYHTHTVDVDAYLLADNGGDGSVQYPFNQVVSDTYHSILEAYCNTDILG